MFIIWSISLLGALGQLGTVSSSTTLEPWEVASIRTFSPPYSPGINLSSGIAFTISDPNTLEAGPAHRGTAIFPPSTANCSGSWTDEGQAYNKPFSCTEVPYGYWSFEIRKPATGYASPMTHFDVRFHRVCNVTVIGSVYSKVFAGQQHFEVGQNMQGLCGASGICSFQLKNESAPVMVTQEMESCSGAC